MSKKFNQYIGKAGHLYVMSEFLMRVWNVAIPEVDIGDDIFVVQDSNGLLERVQVKTATSRIRGSNYSGVFNVSAKNLQSISDKPAHYVFIIRHNHRWSRPLIIRQDYLLNHIETDKIEIPRNGYISLYLAYNGDKVTCSGKDFTAYVGNYADFPGIEH